MQWRTWPLLNHLSVSGLGEYPRKSVFIIQDRSRHLSVFRIYLLVVIFLPPPWYFYRRKDTILQTGDDTGSQSDSQENVADSASAGPVVTMQVASDKPSVRLIGENGNIINPKQIKIVPLQAPLVTSGQGLSSVLPPNIVRHSDGKPIVLTMVITLYMVLHCIAVSSSIWIWLQSMTNWRDIYCVKDMSVKPNWRTMYLLQLILIISNGWSYT